MMHWPQRICPKCALEIYEKNVQHCPYCGYDFRKEDNRHRNIFMAASVAVLIIIMLFLP